METIWEFSLPIIQALQAIHWLEWPMRAITFLGSEPFFLLFGSLLYWCVSPQLGVRVALILLLSTSLNSVLKLGWMAPRPGWVSTQIEVYTNNNSFGLPSAHAQNAIAVWGAIAAYDRRRWLMGLAVVLMGLIGFSRVYLGVHFPTDVIVGWAVGGLVLWLFQRLAGPVTQTVKHSSLRQQGLLALVTSLLLLLPSLLLVALRGDWQLPAAWVQVLQTRFDTLPQPWSLETAVSVAGTWLGFVAGGLWLWPRHPFRAKGPLRRRVNRYAVGIVGAIAIWAGLGWLFPDGQSWFAYGSRYLRYALLGGWIAAGAPLLFQRSRL